MALRLMNVFLSMYEIQLLFFVDMEIERFYFVIFFATCFQIHEKLCLDTTFYLTKEKI